MIRRHRWLAPAGAAALAATLFAAVVLPGPRAVTVPAGLLLALVLPGAAAGAALFAGRQITRVERLVLVPALSLGLLVLGGLGLFACGVPLTRWSWAALTAGTTVLASTVAHLRRRRATPAGAAAPVKAPVRRPVTWRRTAGRLAPLVLAGVLLGGAAWVSIASARAQASRTAVTVLSMTSRDRTASGDRTVTISVEGSGGYVVRVTGPDGFDRILTATTGASGTWSTTLRVPATERVTAALYRASDLTPYRTVFVDGASALAGT